MKKEENLQYQVYSIGVLAISIKALLNFSELVPSNGVIYVLHLLLNTVFIGCMLIKLVLQKYSKTSLITIVAIGLCCVMTYAKVSYYYLICSFLCVVSVQNINLKKLCNMLFKLNTFVLTLHVIIYWIIYYTNRSVIQYSYRNGVGKPRHYFFLGHANVFSMYLTWTCLAYIYSHYEKVTKKKLIFIWLLNIVFYLFTDSNTGIIVLTGVSIVISLQKSNIMLLDKGIHYLAKYGFLFCTIFFPLSIVMYTRYNAFLMSAFTTLNEAFTGRLIYGAFAYDKFGWTLLGKVVYISSKEYWKGYWFDFLSCDNTYIWMFVSYGYIYMIMLAIGLIAISKKTSNIEKILLIAYIFYGVMESYIINAVFCFPMLLVGKHLLEKKGDKETDEERQDRMVRYR